MSILTQIHRHAMTHQGFIWIVLVAGIGYFVGFKMQLQGQLATIVKYVVLAACVLWLYFRVVG